jgi:prephenate dehydratase
MAQTLHKVTYFTVETPHSAGQGVRILAALRDAGVDLLAYSGFPNGGKAQLDFVPAEPARFKAAARKMKLPISDRKFAFYLLGDNTVGALTRVLSKMAKARINITAMQAVTAGKRYGAIFWVKPKSLSRAAKLLGAK